MACYKLTSCTAGDTTVIYTNSNLAAYVGISVEISLYLPGQKCFTVELSDPPCNCTGPIDVTVTLPDCICNTPYTCYKLVDCTDINNFFYTTTNLNAYVGTSVSVFEQPGHCWDVIGIADPVECDTNLPITEPVTCAAPCVCGPVVYCYELTNCLNAQVITINSTQVLTLNHVITPIPAILYPGGNNCWTVTAINIQPCTPDTGVTLIGFSDNGVNGCVACAGPSRCYKLTNCDNTQTVYTQDNLAAFVGLVVTIPALQPSACWLVSDTVECINPAPIDPQTISLNCNCPCYALRNCVTQEIIYTYTNLAFPTNYVGQSVQLVEYGGCGGDCWLVSLNPIPCEAAAVQPVTVQLGCVPCPACDQSCYELVDCETDVVFLTVYNPTINNVNLTLLINGQAIGQIDTGEGIVNGCWYVRPADDCTTAVEVSVFNIYQPTQTLTGCDVCLNSCYGLLNCQTLEIEHIIKYTVPNPNPLIPNPATITGSIGNLCFTPEEGGCVTGCFIFQLIPNVQCDDPIDWTEVVSYDTFDDCDDCLPKCYLLTECAPAVSIPFVVSNDLSLYVGQVAKICDAQGVCHCYSVELAQSCDGAIVLDNANASFITCEECNSCDCPPGYTKIDDNCQKITTVPATRNPIVYSTGPGSINALYGNLGTKFYANISALPYPLTAVVGPDRMVDAALVTVPAVTNVIGVWGGPAGSRLNTIGIWTTVPPNPVQEWIGFAECIDIPTSGTYCIGIAGDDQIRMKIDGVLVALIGIGLFDFNYWHVFEVTLTGGTHVITLEGNNNGGPAAFAAEIYNITSLTLQTYTTVAQVQAVTIFSTFPKRTSGTFQTGETSGFSCAPGYTLNTCDGAPSCSLIETIPFVPCPATFLVRDCAGILPDFLTNTDLSTYVSDIGVSYKACIPAITYSTTCFILKDCSRLVPDIVTNTVLTLFLWQSVQLQGFPGSCFIVTGVPMPEPGVCEDGVAVVVLPAPCDCEGAQQPWPTGCYCVTVEEVFPIVIAPDFQGVFDPVTFDCCESCLQVCYLLTSCVPGIDPVIVCNDLADYVGLVIKIESCGDICWQVEISDTCDDSVTFAGKITPFEDCPNCLPPPPPIPPPFDLHLRKIKPGWKSPNKCYTLEYIEKINCTFGQQVYNNMLVSRYGITVCCEEDINKWDIKKQMLDLDMLKDPNLCKSTLCCCPAPCLIDVVLTLLPFCGAPIVVSVILDLPCPAPVLIDVVLDVPVIPETCNCYEVTYLGPNDITIFYLDCCCKQQSQVLLGNQPPPGITAICAITPPITYDLPVGPYCGCPEGYTYNPSTGLCESITTEVPTLLNPVSIQATLTPSSYYTVWGAVLYPDITSVAYPITADPLVGIPVSPPGSGVFPYFSYPQLLDGALNPLVPTGGILPAPGNLTWGWDTVGAPPPTPGRLNAAGIWAGVLANFEIDFCVDVPATNTYILGIAADDGYTLEINGVTVINSTTSGFGFFSWALFPITLNAGINTFKLSAIDTGLNLAAAFEIYDATFVQLQAVASPAALIPYILFTSSSLIGRNATAGPGTGYSCNEGCELNSCGPVPVCECITTEPYYPCLEVEDLGLCGEAALCNPPPPQICSCWRISNPTSQEGNFSVDTVCPCPPPFFCVGTFGILPPKSLDAYICSIPAPIVSAGLIATNMGPCGTYCGATPPPCVCYEIFVESPAAGCTFSYTDCDGVFVPAYMPGEQTTYVCAQSMPLTDCVQGTYSVSSTPFNCVDGQCGPPFPCDCHIVTVTSPDGQAQSIWYYDCNGVFQNPNLGDGQHYLCGSNFDSFSPYVVFQTTPADCGLGECIAPIPACNCYYFDGVSSPSILTYTDCLGGSQNLPLLPGGFGYICGSAPSSIPPINIVPAPGQCGAQGLPC